MTTKEDYEGIEIFLESSASKDGLIQLLESTVEGIKRCKGKNFRIKLKIIEIVLPMETDSNED
jgi:hypothetical protein